MRHSQRLEIIDDLLYDFARSNELEFARNLAHEPDRVLRQEGNPIIVISIQLSMHWTKVSEVEKSLYDILLAAYYQTPEGKLLVKRTLLVRQVSLSSIVSDLNSLMEHGLQLLRSWTTRLPSNSVEAVTFGWSASAVPNLKRKQTMLHLKDVQQQANANCERMIQQSVHKLW